MNKKLITVIILILTIASLIYFNRILIQENEAFSPSETLGIKKPFGRFGNVTWVIAQDVTPFFLDTKEPTFFLSMQLKLLNFNKEISIFIDSSNTIRPYESIYTNEKNGTYSIDSLPITLSIHKGEYPHDYYIGNISLIDKNSNHTVISTDRINQTYNSTDWKLNIYGDFNKLYFVAYHIKDKNVYNSFITIGLIFLIINIVIFSLTILRHFEKNAVKKSKYSPWIKMGFFVNLSIGIPFYFGAILSDYFLSKQILSFYIIYLYILVVVNLLISSVCYRYGE